MARGELFAIQDEVFADGSNARARFDPGPVSLRDIPAAWEKKLREPRTGRKIKANPGAAEVWLAERQNGAPWRERAERLQQIEDEKAKREMAHKKLSMMSKQVCQALKTAHNVHFESSDLTPMLSEASRKLARGNCDAKSAALMKAVQRFDLRAVAKLLGAHDRSKPAQASLSITTRLPVKPRV